MDTKVLEKQTDFMSVEIEPVTEFSNQNLKELAFDIPKNKFHIYREKIITRSISFIVGILGTIALIPLTFIIFIANKLVKDNGPLFYTQERIGKDGKIFKMIKYRSMVIGADEILKKYLNENKEAKEEFTKYKKLKNDPRITKVGRFLRKTSLDEMPQMINLLLGQMALVGPRPYLPQEKEDMGKYYNIIIKHTPGLTRFMASYWQI